MRWKLALVLVLVLLVGMGGVTRVIAEPRPPAPWVWDGPARLFEVFEDDDEVHYLNSGHAPSCLLNLAAAEDALALFRDAPRTAMDRDVVVPSPWLAVAFDEARRIGRGGRRYVAVPVFAGGCSTGICLRAGDARRTACGDLPQPGTKAVVAALVTPLGGDRYEVGALVTDAVARAAIRLPPDHDVLVPLRRRVHPNLFVTVVRTRAPDRIEVLPRL